MKLSKFRQLFLLKMAPLGVGRDSLLVPFWSRGEIVTATFFGPRPFYNILAIQRPPLGSLLDPFGSLWALFGSLLALSGSLLAPFGSLLALVDAFFAPYGSFEYRKIAIDN